MHTTHAGTVTTGRAVAERALRVEEETTMTEPLAIAYDGSTAAEAVVATAARREATHEGADLREEHAP
jgi:hypothetical protein